jgi:hypothetical protein
VLFACPLARATHRTLHASPIRLPGYRQPRRLSARRHANRLAVGRHASGHFIVVRWTVGATEKFLGCRNKIPGCGNSPPGKRPMIAPPTDPTARLARPAAAAPGRLAGNARQPTTILVLDEDDATHSAVEISAGDLAPIIHATNPVDAFRLLDDEAIGVIVSARRLGSMDLTHLLCLVKRQHPEIVSIVVGEAEPGKLLGRLIADEQIFQFVTKPLKAGSLRPGIKAALDRRAALPARPAMPSPATAVPAAAAAPQRPRSAPTAGFGRTLASRLRRLLWP